ncbi:MAG: prolipoprotein diacylglyceryl transferase [Bacteroidota bacterium]
MIAAIVWDIDPRVFPAVDYLRWYGLCWALGLLLGYRIVQSIYHREEVPVSELEKLATYVMIGAIVGARLGHILFYDPVYYYHHPIEILPISWEPSFRFTGLAGLASHGGILGALLALYLYHRKSKTDYWWMLDRLTIGGVALGGFIRLGNLLNSEIIGIPTQVPWAFVFLRVDQTPRHPTQLYEAIFYFATSWVLYWVWRSNRFAGYHGFLFGLGMLSIFFQRFLIEYLKENQVEFEANLFLNMGQILSIPLILLGVATMGWSLRSSRASNGSA